MKVISICLVHIFYFSYYCFVDYSCVLFCQFLSLMLVVIRQPTPLNVQQLLALLA